MFLSEARLAARLHHQNVVQTNEVIEVDGAPVLVMEYLDGQPLSQVITRGKQGGFSLAMQLRVLVDALAGLHAAHELADFDGTPLGVVHRDVSPHNLFVTLEGHAKVLDFGIAKLERSLVETEVGTVKGKLRYMAPEQIRGDKLDRRADIYAAGVMLWEALTGERMWKVSAEGEIRQRVLEGNLPMPETVRPDVPAPLARICRRALSRAPDDRYATARQLADELEAAMSELGLAASHREIGATVARLFDDVRRETKRTIEDKLGRASMATPIQAVTGTGETPTGRRTGAPFGRAPGAGCRRGRRADRGGRDCRVAAQRHAAAGPGGGPYGGADSDRGARAGHGDRADRERDRAARRSGHPGARGATAIAAGRWWRGAGDGEAATTDRPRRSRAGGSDPDARGGGRAGAGTRLRASVFRRHRWDKTIQARMHVTARNRRAPRWRAAVVLVALGMSSPRAGRADVAAPEPEIRFARRSVRGAGAPRDRGARRRRGIEGGLSGALRGGPGRAPRAPAAGHARRAARLLGRVVPVGHPRRLRRLAGAGCAQLAVGGGDRARARRRHPRREGVHRRQAGGRKAERLRAGDRSRPAQVPLRVAALAGDRARRAGQRRRQGSATSTSSSRRRYRSRSCRRPNRPSRSAWSDPTTSSAASRWPGSPPSPTSAAPASTTRISSRRAACPSATPTTCRRWARS